MESSLRGAGKNIIQVTEIWSLFITYPVQKLKYICSKQPYNRSQVRKEWEGSSEIVLYQIRLLAQAVSILVGQLLRSRLATALGNATLQAVSECPQHH